MRKPWIRKVPQRRPREWPHLGAQREAAAAVAMFDAANNGAPMSAKISHVQMANPGHP